MISQFTLTLTRCGATWTCQGMGLAGFGPTAFEAIEKWKDQIIIDAADTYILSQGEIVHIPIEVEPDSGSLPA